MRAERETGYGAGPRPHGVYPDRDRHGNPRISVTLPRKGQNGGKRLKYLTGHNRNIAYPYLSSILFDHTGRRFAFDSQSLSSEYHNISEDAAIHMMLLMEAVRNEPEYAKSVALAQAIANMNYCEAKWWFARYATSNRSRKVMRALALMHV